MFLPPVIPSLISKINKRRSNILKAWKAGVDSIGYND